MVDFQSQIQSMVSSMLTLDNLFAMNKFMPNTKISEVHGQAMRVKGRLVVAFYHPAAALHQPSLRPVVEGDFAKLPELIKKAADVPEYVEQNPENNDEDKPEQLSLF